MSSRVFWFSVTYYLACVLYKTHALSESTPADGFATINDASRLNAEMSKIENTGMWRSIEMQTRANGIILKDSWPKYSILQDSPIMKNLLVKRESKIKCSRYCIQLETDKSDTYNNVNLSWSFEGKLTDADYLPLINNSRLKISQRISTDNNNSTTLNRSCQIYLNLGCDILSMKETLMQDNKFYSNSQNNYQNADTVLRVISEFSKKLVHRTNLSGYTETKFYIDSNATVILINIWGNLKRASLTIPIDKTMQKPGITISLISRRYEAKGVAISAQNAPPGGWCVKLTGVENSKYSFDVIAYYGMREENIKRNRIIGSRYASESNKELNFHRKLDKRDIVGSNETVMIINKTKEFNGLVNTQRNTADEFINSVPLMNTEMKEEPKFVFERSVEMMESTNNEDQTTLDNSVDMSLFLPESTANFINDNVLRNKSITSYGGYEIPRNISDKAIFNGKLLALQQQQKIQVRSSEVTSLNEDIDINVKPFANNNVSTQTIDSDQKVLSQQSAISNNEELLGRRAILIEVNSNSNLFAVPGTIHRVTFDVTNNCVLPVRYTIRGRSSPFRIQYIEPPYTWLHPGQTNYITAYIAVPRGINQDTVNTLTLFIDGTKITEKTVYIYVQGGLTKRFDDTKPTIEYSFNSNCAGKLHRDRCAKTSWSADITVRDSDSGLKRVVSAPNDIYPRYEFISGTKETVTFYYTSTCCANKATITAIDASNNEYSHTIDVTAWDNLSEGEIAAITVGTLFILLLIILLIILIIFCFRKRSSHDLPYTQRYGSRPPARSERTSF